MHFETHLPIDDVLGKLRETLARRNSAVLVAPPGAGKTTRVPLALMEEPWLNGRKILVLEPRRIAARGAASRMAGTLGEKTGGTIGLRARLSSNVGPGTRVEVVTEGVFTRMVLDDPGLDGIGAVLFDEFHERSLDADLGLAFALDCQRELREDLRLLVMSATLDGARVAKVLGNAPEITCEGRAFEVETRYVSRNPAVRIEDQMTGVIQKALLADTGSILAFLPGQGEIRRVEERLNERLDDTSVLLAPLYGAMDMTAQDRAIAPAPLGQRKVVLATSIAETSLTIEGVRIVIDSGLARVPRFEPDAGVTRLETVRVSRAAADQRRGRAGRTGPGICYRLWDEPQTQSLLPFADPEIRSADLAGLLLDCAEWGAAGPAALSWLDPPPAAAVAAARSELMTLGALDDGGRITQFGRAMRSLPLPPRLARMVLAAAGSGAQAAAGAAEIAALLVEPGLGDNDSDIANRLTTFRQDRSRRAADMRGLAHGWARLASTHMLSRANQRQTGGDVPSAATLLAYAYPDRIAKARGAPGHFLLANGRGARIDDTDPLARSQYLVVAELQGAAAATRILLAAAASEAEIVSFAGPRITHSQQISFDAPAAALRARRIRRLDAIELENSPEALHPDAASAVILARGIADLGIDRLPWNKSQIQLRKRVAFVRVMDGAVWPDLSDQALAAEAETWLAPFLISKTRLSGVSGDDLAAALDTLLPWDLRRRLDDETPTHFVAPTGNRFAVEYEGAGAPSVSIRVQELFGLSRHPAIAGGRLPLTLNLLSPAHRPIQITRDLPGFWAGSWAAVKSDMRGKYPRHAWPDDPANAQPTARAKPRGS